jgi:hypothetical protein
MVIGTPHVVRVRSLKPKDDPVLVVDANRVEACEVAHERVQSVARRHLQIIELVTESIWSSFRWTIDGSRGMRLAALLLTSFQMSLVVSSASVRITSSHHSTLSVLVDPRPGAHRTGNRSADVPDRVAGWEAGWRCGEMLALEWCDVDLVNRQLCVRRSDWNGQVGTPKGGRRRYVPLTRRLTAAIAEYRHLRSNRLFCEDDRTPFTRQN